MITLPNNPNLNRKSKDSVFVKFFSDKKNIAQMYNELHPELEKKITEDDITVDTLETIMVHSFCNDLGFSVNDTYVNLFEAQTGYSPNVSLRMFFYLADTYNQYLIRTGQSEHDSTKVKLPAPELYLIYAGPGRIKDEISLREDYFKDCDVIELKIKVIHVEDGTLIGQYISFCRVFNEQRRLFSNGVEAAKETYRICIEEGYLADFMRENQKEVIDVMARMFDEDFQREQYENAMARKYKAIGRAEGRAEGKEEGIEEGFEKGALESKISTALKMLKSGKYPKEDIADSTDLPLEKIAELANGM